MTLGQKIKAIRVQKKITQSALAKDQITRNMLSAIENDKAQPSLSTLVYIAKCLGVPPEYLLSDKDDLAFYIKRDKIDSIRFAYQTQKYKYWKHRVWCTPPHQSPAVTASPQGEALVLPRQQVKLELDEEVERHDNTFFTTRGFSIFMLSFQEQCRILRNIL